MLDIGAHSIGEHRVSLGVRSLAFRGSSTPLLPSSIFPSKLKGKLLKNAENFNLCMYIISELACSGAQRLLHAWETVGVVVG
jgi:hypothetical protein